MPERTEHASEEQLRGIERRAIEVRDIHQAPALASQAARLPGVRPDVVRRRNPARGVPDDPRTGRRRVMAENETPAGSPEDGHTFEITHRSRGSYGAAGQPGHQDADHWGEPLTVTVRAWCLRDALTKAAALPLDAWPWPNNEPDDVPAGCPFGDGDPCEAVCANCDREMGAEVAELRAEIEVGSEVRTWLQDVAERGAGHHRHFAADTLAELDRLRARDEALSRMLRGMARRVWEMRRTVEHTMQSYSVEFYRRSRAEDELQNLRDMWPLNGLDQPMNIRGFVENHKRWTEEARREADELRTRGKAALALVGDLLRPWATARPVHPGYAGLDAGYQRVGDVQAWRDRRDALARAHEDGGQDQ